MKQKADMHSVIMKFSVPDREGGTLPTKDPSDVGFDICSTDFYDIEPLSTLRIKTGVYFGGIWIVQYPGLLSGLFATQASVERLSEDHFAKIEGRSGLAANFGIFPVGGIIDQTYRGEIAVVLHNSGRDRYSICPGDRVAQIVIYSSPQHAYSEEISVKNMTETKRGSKGFGSSGR